ncbi:FAD-dependent oxidoreductase [Corticibacter populi]|uniref:tRNA 5-methylaminomethyl-2-thiouridine biosynthesis bifunctional protein MnmC n=1 Tax=Corticibacter populi TaxID=1550736 RepID=A0A3M6QID1_9BURK|nr:FAD-dependent 5-carboxymethylaminomethyl-2-thiouridine(34) oxidoreductase MnmC [Corticibacter populi]RMX02222.1 FAD-dependent oxidoreductase [Corticibacter populi]RZS29509.1 tRNA 5-methylaminomethyl-2-thiouridine biosynthesis bifunctional protein [Corticibacter populi]
MSDNPVIASAPSPSLAWLDDGTPYSPRFGDRYHSRQDGGVTQSRSTFLQGCGLPAAWRGQPQWRILETGFGLGLNFLVTWQAWQDDPARPRQLHFISTEAWPVDTAALLAAARSGYPALLPLAEQLAEQYLDMHSGVHRLVFDDGGVQLTLGIGDARQLLREQGWTADSVYLDGFDPAKNPGIWSVETLKAIARCSLPGHTRLATWCVARSVREALGQCGFAVERVAGTPPKKHNLQARFAPAWQPRPRNLPWPRLPEALRERAQRHCLVIGAGIAGASLARAMAERGWRVTVLEQAADVAQGASALPTGLFAPHISPDDAPLSRLTRAGVRSTRRHAARLLRDGRDWQASGVLEHRVGKKAGLPAPSLATVAAADNVAVPDIASHASRLASAEQRQQAGLGTGPVASDDGQQGQGQKDRGDPAVWHALAGWIKPAALVRALLAHPGITVRTHAVVDRLTPTAGPTGAGWQALDASGQELAHADCAIIAAAFGSKSLAQTFAAGELPLNAVRGQVAFGELPKATNPLDAPDSPDAAPAWPPFPVNGKGSFIHVPVGDDPAGWLWISGGTFERSDPLAPPDVQAIEAALQENRQRLALLMPAKAAALDAALFDAQAPAPLHWWQVRCTVPDRTPMYGPVDPARPDLLLATGLGSRGLTLACLCAEILAACLHDEPLPVDAALARLVLTTRLHGLHP